MKAAEELVGEWGERAAAVLPAGITHDVRRRSPRGPCFVRGRGPLKWDVDGREFVDYSQGHGSLLLGNAPPEVTRAIADAAASGTHLGGNHPAEIEWAELIRTHVPCADKVRFTSSGTEASLLAMRLARATTGRPAIVKLAGHFHGWHDYAAVGVAPPFDVPVSPGIPRGVLSTVDVVDENPAAVEARLRRGDVAALILEPTGASWGTVEMPVEHLAQFRRLASLYDVVLIFDEVVSGFRVHPGGVQAMTGVIPDVCLLGKVVAGGMPGGAVAGGAEFLAPLEFSGDEQIDRFEHVYHPGTFNANPVSAAAGIAMLRAVGTGEPSKQARETAVTLRRGIAEAVHNSGFPGAVYGQSSWFHVVPGVTEPPQTAEEAKKADARLVRQADATLLEHGVDTMRLGGFVGTSHAAEQLERTVDAYRAAFELLKKTEA